MLYAILKPVAVMLMRLYFRVERRGWKHVPRTGPVLLVANHSSVLDPPVIAGMAPRQVTFLAKAELFRIPLFGGLIRRLNARPLRREGADPSALRTALRALEEGRTLLVFPEGTRGEEGVLRPAKAGAGMLAVLSRAPVVPVFVSGTGRAWPRGRTLPRPCKVRVVFGPPLGFAAEDPGGRKQAYDVASREMMAAIARVRDGLGRDDAPATAGGDRHEVGASTAPKFIDGRNGVHGEG